MANTAGDRNAQSRRRSNLIVLVTLIAYACGALFYMLGYVPRHRAEIAGEALRELSSAADQVVTRLAAMDTVWKTEAQRLLPATDSRQLKLRLERLNRVAAPLRFSSVNLVNDELSCQQAGEQTAGGARLDLTGDPVSFSYRSRGLCGEVAVATIVERILKSVSSDLFDDLGVATLQGDVLFEYPRSSIRTATLVTVFNQLAGGPQPMPAAPAPQSGDAKSSAAGGFAAAGMTRITDVHLGGSDYVAFLEPVGWPVQSRVSDSRAPLLLYGIVDAHKLWTRSISVPGHVLAVGILALLAVLSYLWALLKLWVMSPGEGFRPVEAMFFSVSVLGALGLLVILALYQNVRDLDKREQQRHLQGLADNIDVHLKQELRLAVDILDRFSNCVRGSHADLTSANLACSEIASEAVSLHVDRSIVADGPDMYWAAPLFKVARQQLKTYPYPDVVFWTNEKGIQTLKLCALDDCTSQTDLKQFPWFRRATAGQLFSMAGTETRFQLDCLYSPNTGLYEALLLAPQPQSSDTLRFIGLAVPLLSLIAPTLPPGYGFAVIDQLGAVKFHSNASLNGTNSFLADWENGDRLGSSLALGASGSFSGDYRGEPSQGYLKPLTSVKGLGWSVVAIHSDVAWDALSLRVLLLALFGCALLAVPLGILAVLAGWHLASVSRPPAAPGQARRPPPRWYWPDPAKWRLYLVLLTVYVVLILTGVWSRAIWAALLLPIAAILVTWAGLWGHYCWHMFVATKPRQDIRAVMAVLYTANATLAAVLLVILPASLIVQRAFDLERVGYLAQKQLGLAQTVIGRNERLQQRLSTFADEEFVREMQRQSYDRHDCGWFNAPCDDSPGTPSPGPGHPGGEMASVPWDARVARWFQQGTADPFGMSSSSATWSQVGGNLRLFLPWPTPSVSVMSTLPAYELGMLTAVLIAVAIAGVALAVWFVSCRRFTLLRDLPEPWSEHQLHSPVSENLLVLTPPRAANADAEAMGATYTSDLSRHADAPPGETDKVILLTHLESALEDKNSRERALRTIQSVIAKPHSRAILVSTIDPVFWLKDIVDQGNCDGAEYSRWVNVFSAFKTVRLAFPETPELPGEYHHLLWSSCTRGEKIALLQLARDGFVNPKNWEACEHLARRGVVSVGRHDATLYAIKHKAFCDFVLSGFAEEEVATYVAGDDRLPWRTLRLVLACTLALLVAFLGFSLQEIFGAAAGSLVSITAGLTGFVTLMSSLRQFAGLRLPFMKGSGNA